MKRLFFAILIVYLFSISTVSAGLPNASMTSLLHMNWTAGTANFTDESGAQWSSVGTATTPYINTSFEKFGNASGQFTGSTSMVTVANSSAWIWGTNHTVEFWFYPTGSNANKMELIEQGINGVQFAPVDLLYDSTNKNLVIYASSTGASWDLISAGTTAANSVPFNQWSHIELDYNKPVYKIYINGLLAYSITTSVVSPFVSSLNYSYGNTAANFISPIGYMDEVAQWSITLHMANFTPPTAEYSTAPVASFAMSNSSGVGTALVNFTDTSTNAPTSWNWTFTNITGNNTEIGFATTQYPNYIFGGGNWSIRLTATNICGSNTTAANTRFVNVSVSSLLPVVTFAANVTTGIEPAAILFTDTSLGYGASWWNWSYGDGNMANYTVQTSPAHIYSNGGLYTVNETITNVAGSTTSVMSNYITIGNPTVSGFMANITSGYAALPVAFIVTNSNDNATFWNWSPGDGSTWTNGSVQNYTYIYTTYGAHTVTEMAGNVYTSSTTTKTNYVMTFNPQLITNFTGSPTIGYEPLSVIFTDTSMGSGINQWNWSFGDGAYSSLENPGHTYTTTGYFTVILNATNNSGSSNILTRPNYFSILSSTIPTVNFWGDTGTVTSIGKPIGFVDSSTNNPTSWYWDFGDGSTSTQQNPSHAYSSFGYFNVSHSATNRFGTSWLNQTNYVLINPVSPLILTSFTGTPASGLASLNVAFIDTSIALPYPVTSWSWNFGDTGTSVLQNPAHTYNTPGTYSVSLTTTNANATNSTTYVNYIMANAPIPSTAFIKSFTNNGAITAIIINRYNYGALSMFNPDTLVPLTPSQTLVNLPDSTTLDTIPTLPAIAFYGDDGSYWIYRTV